MSKIGAIIQARMGSRRLPGKVLKEVNKRSLLSYLVERLKSSESLDKIVVATSATIQDDAIASECKSLGVSCFRGSESDVLDRFYHAALEYDIDTIVRITADCPLVMPSLINRVCGNFLEKHPDYLRHRLPYPEGLADISIFPLSILKIAWDESHLLSEREHVVPFILNHPERFSIVYLKVESDLNQYRFTVDEELDFYVVKHILETLYDKPKKIFGIPELENYVKQYPHIVGMNIHIRRNKGYQKSLLEDAEWKKNIQ